MNEWFYRLMRKNSSSVIKAIIIIYRFTEIANCRKLKQGISWIQFIRGLGNGCVCVCVDYYAARGTIENICLYAVWYAECTRAYTLSCNLRKYHHTLNKFRFTYSYHFTHEWKFKWILLPCIIYVLLLLCVHQIKDIRRKSINVSTVSLRTEYRNNSEIFTWTNITYSVCFQVWCTLERQSFWQFSNLFFFGDDEAALKGD